MLKYTDGTIEIIMILSDDEGHALWDIAKKLGRYKSSLSRTMKLLEEGTPNLTDDPFSVFSFGEIKDLDSLVTKLRGGADPLSQFIYEGFSNGTKRILSESNDRNLKRSKLVEELYKLIDRPPIYNKGLFSHVKLSERTMVLVNQLDPQQSGINPVLNRFLLQDAYPNELGKIRKPIIYTGEPRRTTNENSKRPNAKEYPYYINKDLFVFSSIIYHFIANTKNYWDIKLNISLDEHFKSQDNLYEWPLTPAEKRNIEEDMSEFTYNHHDREHWDKKAQENNNLYESFLTSKYVSNLIKEYSFTGLIGLMKSYGVSQHKMIVTAQCAFKNGIISKEELDELAPPSGYWLEVENI